MTHTYHGTKVTQEWLPLAMANGLEDRQWWNAQGRRKMEPLYTKLAPRACRVLYHLGWTLGRWWWPTWCKPLRNLDGREAVFGAPDFLPDEVA